MTLLSGAYGSFLSIALASEHRRIWQPFSDFNSFIRVLSNSFPRVVDFAPSPCRRLNPSSAKIVMPESFNYGHSIMSRLLCPSNPVNE